MEENTTSASTNCSRLSPAYLHAVILNQVLSACGVLACLFAIFIITVFKKWQCFTQRLIIYLIISTTLVSLTRALQRFDYNGESTRASRGFCTFIAYITQNVVWMLIFSLLFITLYLFLAVVCNRRTEKYEGVYVFFIFVFPWTFNWIPFIKNTYGQGYAICWISSLNADTCEFSRFGQVFQIVLFYLPLTLLVVVKILAYLLILWKLHRLNKRWKTSISNTPEEEAANKMMRTEVYSLFAYPLIYITSLIIILFQQINSWVVSPELPSVALWYVSGVALAIVPILFVLTFTLDKDTRQRLRWKHIKAAIKNYNVSKVISEYEDGNMDAVEASYANYAKNKVAN